MDYPSWVCYDCGMRLGRREYGDGEMKSSTWHTGRCDVCGETKSVTEPRDFGHLVNLSCARAGFSRLNVVLAHI